MVRATWIVVGLPPVVPLYVPASASVSPANGRGEGRDPGADSVSWFWSVPCPLSLPLQEKSYKGTTGGKPTTIQVARTTEG